jgi:hypothetical protein
MSTAGCWRVDVIAEEPFYMNNSHISEIEWLITSEV